MLGGSFTFPDGFDRAIQVVEEYDPLKNLWTTAGELVMNTAYVPALEVDGRILVMPLGDAPSSQEFDPGTRRTQLNWSVPSGKRWAQCAAIIGRTIYQAGGWKEPGKPLATFDAITLPAK